MHQGSAQSPLLFVIVMEAIPREFRVALPWELLYADDLVVIVETEEDLIKGAQQPISFQSMSIATKHSPISDTAELLYNQQKPISVLFYNICTFIR